MFFFIWFIGIGLRLTMLITSRSLWGDEIHSWYWATQSDWRGIIATCFTVNHPPLYYFVLQGFIALFGEQESAFRFASALPGILTVWVVYRLGRETVSKNEALWAAFFVSFSAYFLHASSEIRSYGLLAFLASLNMLFFMKAQKKSRYLPAYAMSAPLITGIEHIGMFIPLGTTLFILFRKKWGLIRTQIAVFLLHLPWASLMLWQAFHNEKVQDVGRLEEYWSAGILLKKAAGIFWHIADGYRYSMLTLESLRSQIASSPIFWAHALLAGGSFTLFIAGWSLSKRSAKNLFVLIGTIFVFPLALLLAVYPIRLSARYLIFAAPLYYLAISKALILAPRWFRIVFAGIFLCVNLTTAYLMIKLPTDVMHKDDFKSLVDSLAGQMDGKTALVGSKTHHRYFMRGLGLPENVPYFQTSTLGAENTRAFQRLWLIRMGNMHPKVTERILEEDAPLMETLGFKKKNCERFGGETLTYACLYERS